MNRKEYLKRLSYLKSDAGKKQREASDTGIKYHSGSDSKIRY